jgi:sugar lactone lactonase YvrE
LATQVLGQANFTSNTAATTQIRMDNPYGVAVDPATYKVFVAELNNHRVLRFASLFALSNGAAAEAVLGQANFTSGSPNRGGAAAANTLNGPTGVFVDTGGRLWVADYNNHRVLRFNNASTKSNGANADGVLGQANFTSSAPATSQSRMNYPVGVFVDSGGRLWVADSDNHRVLRFDNAASKANGANADGVLGQANFTSNTTATSKNRMDKPVGVYLDPGGRLWVTEFNNNRLMRFNNAAAKANGANADGVLGQANFTSSGSACASMAMDTPRGVAGDSAGRIYVADGNNHRVLVFEDAATSPNGNAADDVIGQPNFTNCSLYSAWPTAGSLNTPALIFYDIPMGVLWVADWNNNRVLRYDPYQLKLFLPIVEK